MKLPDLTDLEAAGVRELAATSDALSGAAATAKLKYFAVDLTHAESKNALLDALARGLALPAHFGNNWDALADCLEDDDVMGRHGAVVRVAHAAPFRKAHSADWTTLEEILNEAAEFWKERHVPFWVFVA